MPVYYNPGSSFTKISKFSSQESTAGVHVCVQGDYWSAPAGTCVAAAAAGRVHRAGKEEYGFGYYVVVEHLIKNINKHIYTIYAHLNALPIVKVDDMVKRGDTLGYVGNSGNTKNAESNDLFFHFEIRVGGYWVTDAASRNLLVRDPASFDLSTLDGFAEIEKTNKTCEACLLQPAPQSEPASEPPQSDLEPELEPEPVSQPVSTIGGAAPCTSGKAAIQVTGYGHIDKPQQIIFYDKDITQPTITKEEDLEKTAEDNIRSYNRNLAIKCPSTLFKWEKCNIDGQKLALSIEKEKGGHIYLPVADQITFDADNDKSQYHKSNMFLAFVPLTAQKFLSGSKDNYFASRIDRGYGSGTPSEDRTSEAANARRSMIAYTSARQGFLYLFINGKLWRELKIEQDATGKNYFKDIDLSSSQYRNEDGSFKELKVTYKIEGRYALTDDDQDERSAEGKALEEIWVPYKLSNKEVQPRILFCEEQLAGPRLNYLEKNGLPGTTLISYTSYIKPARGESIVADNMTTTYPFRLDFIPQSKPRGIDEWRFNDPTLYTTGNIEGAYSATANTDQLCMQPDTPAKYIVEGNFNNAQMSRGTYAHHGSRYFEIDAWRNILLAQYAEDKTIDSFWQTPVNKNNQIDSYKSRYINGIVIPDPLHEVHRLQQLLSTAQVGDIFAYLTIRSSEAKHGAVGRFSYNMASLFPEVMQGIANLDKDTRHQFNRSICDAERTYLINRMHLWIHQLTKELEKPETIQAFLNLLSNHRPKKYATAQSFFRNCVRVLSKSPESFDPLANTLTPVVTPGQLYIYQLACNTQSKAHQALWPYVASEEQLQKPAVCPLPQEGDNLGDGKFYAPALRAVQEWNITAANIDELNTPIIQAFALQGEAQNSALAELLRTSVKTGMSGVVSLVNILTQAVDDSREALTQFTKSRNAAIKAQIAESRAKQQAQGSSDVKNKAQLEFDIKSEEYQQASQKLDQAEIARAKQEGRVAVTSEQVNTVKANSGKVFRNRMHVSSLEDIRLAIDEFKHIEYVKVNPTTKTRQGYIVLGVTTKENLQAMDDFYKAGASTSTPSKSGHLVAKYNQLNEILGTTSSNAAKLGGLNHVEDLFLLAIPATEQNKKILQAYIESVDHYLELLLKKFNAEWQAAAKAATASGAKTTLDTATKLSDADMTAAAAAEKNAIALETLMNDAYNQHQAIPYRARIVQDFEKALNHPAIPGVLFMVEVWNFTSVVNQYDSLAENRGDARARLGATSAFLDMLYGYSLMREKMQMAGRAKGLLDYRAIMGKKFYGPVANLLKVSGVPLGGLVGAGLMGITTAINFWDMFHAMGEGNPAWFGYLVSGVGSSILTVQALMAPTALLLGIGPLGWLVIGVTIMLVGGYLTAVLNRQSEVEEWFARGPFGTGGIVQTGKDILQWGNDLFTSQEMEADYSYLEQDSEAIYRLISILLDFRMELSKVDQAAIKAEITQLNSQSRLDEQQHALNQTRLTELRKIEQATYKFSLLCNCANLINPLNDTTKVALARYDVMMNQVYYKTLEWQTDVSSESVLHISKETTKVDFYLKELPLPQGYSFATTFSELEVRMQIQGTPQNKDAGTSTRYFPAPLLRHNLQYKPSRDSVPFFRKNSTNKKAEYQPFWYSGNMEVSSVNIK